MFGVFFLKDSCLTTFSFSCEGYCKTRENEDCHFSILLSRNLEIILALGSSWFLFCCVSPLEDLLDFVKEISTGVFLICALLGCLLVCKLAPHLHCLFGFFGCISSPSSCLGRKKDWCEDQLAISSQMGEDVFEELKKPVLRNKHYFLNLLDVCKGFWDSYLGVHEFAV